jgi:hypothetical protein
MVLNLRWVWRRRKQGIPKHANGIRAASQVASLQQHLHRKPVEAAQNGDAFAKVCQGLGVRWTARTAFGRALRPTVDVGSTQPVEKGRSHVNARRTASARTGPCRGHRGEGNPQTLRGDGRRRRLHNGAPITMADALGTSILSNEPLRCLTTYP